VRAVIAKDFSVRTVAGLIRAKLLQGAPRGGGIRTVFIASDPHQKIRYAGKRHGPRILTPLTRRSPAGSAAIRIAGNKPVPDDNI